MSSGLGGVAEKWIHPAGGIEWPILDVNKRVLWTRHGTQSANPSRIHHAFQYT